MRGTLCLEGGALRSWKLVGGRGQSYCQELGSNSNTSGLLSVGGGDKAHWMKCRQSWSLTAGPSIRPPDTEPTGLMRTGEPVAAAVLH